MKRQVFYVHGGESFHDHALFLERLRTKGIWDLPGTESAGKWTDRLVTDLGDAYEVFRPQMPNKQNAHYEEWKIWFERHFEHLRDGVILVGCSLGGMFLLKYLLEVRLPVEVRATYLMATPIGLNGFDSRDCADFITPAAAVSELTGAGEVFVLHSTDDFVVPYEHGEKLAELLPEARLMTFSDKNHFLGPELPELAAHIKGLG